MKTSKFFKNCYSFSFGISRPRRVVVTGIGIVSPIGNTVHDFWKNLITNECGIYNLDEEGYNLNSKIPSRIAGIVRDFDFDDYLDKCEKEVIDESKRIIKRRLSRNLQFSIAAASDALSDAKYDGYIVSEKEQYRSGCCIGTGLGSLEEIQSVNELLINDKYRSITPFSITRILQNMLPGYVGINHNLKGPNFSLNSACSTGGLSIGMGYNLIRMNQADLMVVGGSESSINDMCLSTFSRIGALATKYNDDPSRSSRPFDQDRDGFVVGEGAGVLVLEELEHAMERDAHIYAEIRGFSATCDSHKLTASDPKGMGQLMAMKNCLDDLNVPKEMVNYVNCHATSTQTGDEAEYNAIKKVFGEKQIVHVSSIKGSIGHLLGAAGAVEAIATIMSINNQQIPPNYNYNKSNFELSENIRIVTKPTTPIDDDIQVLYALSNSFGFGGTNNCILFTFFDHM